MDDLVSPDSGSLDTGEGATRKRALVVAHAHVRVLEIWQILGVTFISLLLLQRKTAECLWSNKKKLLLLCSNIL